MNLSDDATFFLLRLVEQFPALWDMTLAEYADTTVKESIWERIAKEMNEEWPAYGPYDANDAAAATDDQNITVDDPIAGKALSAMSRQGTQKKRRRSPHRLDEILAQRQTVLEKIAASVGQPASTTQQEDDIDYFGKVVAAHMREVPKDKLIPCQKAILSALEIYINKSE
ncbi:hypothetical protein HPB51_009110 [Rhipicephalus microplus]|uniref:MADF domain-containing protein n=1 Tax=Rhipicephalus microplus TaxID=6941 RepID=A0A9J6EVP8_RHIMP|nr:hypothetical protein HPB51_003570 [Rhipicephalus microplus]KAH8038361.1 hypothetical protein HPB51_001144 [Rhipicephalus microplus]KAH8039854.1 hypothetical protein HPB51_009110 [Rhipicephalus microplus]